MPLRFLLATVVLLNGSALGFEVTRNVNTGKPPEEKAVLFEKGQAADTLTFFDTESGRMALNSDGEIEARITGNGEVKCGINWKPRGALGGTFNPKDYGHVVITCRMEGGNKTAGSGAPGQRPDNLWFSAALFDAGGEVVGSANLADGTPDGKTPDKTTTVVLPMMLFTYFGDHDSSEVRGVGFIWPKARASVNRDYKLIIEKIALAE